MLELFRPENEIPVTGFSLFVWAETDTGEITVSAIAGDSGASAERDESARDKDAIIRKIFL